MIQPILLDIYDSRTWNSLRRDLQSEILRNGPKRDMSLMSGPKDAFGTHFSSSCYVRYCSNGEELDRN